MVKLLSPLARSREGDGEKHIRVEAHHGQVRTLVGAEPYLIYRIVRVDVTPAHIEIESLLAPASARHFRNLL